MRITIPHSLGATVLTILSPTVSGYIQLHSPPPFNASNNPHRTSPPDQSLNTTTHDIFNTSEPLCRGYLSLLGKPQGAPTATWAAGSNQTWSLQVGDDTGHGSCIVGFLDPRQTTGYIHDGFKDFKEVMEYKGTCPHRYAGNGPDNQQFNLTVPKDLSLGVKVFVWIFYNLKGKYNMNCAAVNITTPHAGPDIGGGDPQPDLRGSQTSSSGSTRMSDLTDQTSTTFTTLRRTYTTVTTTTVPSPQALSAESNTGGLAVTTTTVTLPAQETNSGSDTGGSAVTTTTTTLPLTPPTSSQTGFALAPSPPSKVTTTSGETTLSPAQSFNGQTGASGLSGATSSFTSPQADSLPSDSGSPLAPSAPSAVNTPSGEEVTTTLPASTTTVTTTIEPSDGNSITTTISGISVFSSLLASPAPVPSSPDTSFSGPGASASSSESVTTVNITTTIPADSYSGGASVSNSRALPSTDTVTSGSTALADSHSLTTPASTSPPSPTASMSGSLTALTPNLSPFITHIGPSAPLSASSTPSTSLPGVKYTSTTKTILRTITEYNSPHSASGSGSGSGSAAKSTPASLSASASASSTASTLATQPTAAADSNAGTVHFNTTNGCSCACPANEPTNIEGCNCYCDPPEECLRLMNKTTNFTLDPADVSSVEKDSVARPDDLVAHDRRSNRSNEDYSTTITVTSTLDYAS